MKIKELLNLRGMDTKLKIKLVRHQDSRFDLWELYRTGHFDTYQSYQSKPIFHNCDYIVSFMGLDGSRAQLIGVYKVSEKKISKEIPIPDDFPHRDFFSDLDDYFYKLEPVNNFNDLKDRVIIDWGLSPRAWHQWLDRDDKEVIEILPEGYIKEFPGYLDFILTFDELVRIVQNPVANREWHRMLSAVAGIYLIVDNKTGKQYIGSAYGKDGIWGRWAKYAQTSHGGNELIKELIDSESEYASNFRFTLLHVLLKTATKDEVIAWEVRYKNKLGTKAFGLNLN